MPSGPTFPWTDSEGKPVQREILRPDDARIAGSPHPDLVRHLVTLSWRLSDPGLATDRLPLPDFGYGPAAKSIQASSVIDVFAPLGAVQDWCLSQGLFDLTALVLARTERCPGRGHFTPWADCANPDAWRQYLKEAAHALRTAQATSKPGQPPAPVAPARAAPGSRTAGQGAASPTAPQAAHLWVREVVLRNVRSFAGEHRIPLAPVTLLFGTNDTGKTTILESLDLLAAAVRAGSAAWSGHEKAVGTSGAGLPQIAPRGAPGGLAAESTQLRQGDADDAGSSAPAVGIGLRRTSGAALGGLWAVRSRDSNDVTEVLISEAADSPGDAFQHHFRHDPDTCMYMPATEMLASDMITGLPPSAAWPSARPEGPFSHILEAVYQACLHVVFLRTSTQTLDRLPVNSPNWIDSAATMASEAGEEDIRRWNEAFRDFMPDTPYEVVRGAHDTWELKKTSLHDTVRLLPTKVGTGVQKFLALAAWLTKPAPSTFLLQEPEAHLHPQMQLRLADLILDAAARGHTLVVETHSEHFAERIARRWREARRAMMAAHAPATESTFARMQQAHHLPVEECLSLLRVQQQAGASSVHRINLMADGSIAWPRDFFGQQYDERLS